MINARLNNILQDDDELFNRIKAYGPGDGINRVSVVVEDATSIATYGLRETTETFLDATDRSDLETKATGFLNEKKDPVTQVSFTLFLNESYAIGKALFSGEVVTFDGEAIYFYDAGDGEYPDVVRGDTIRIVSQELNLNTTGVVQEIDWEPGQVTLTIGKKDYNLLDVINGPRDDAERERAALGLPTPIGFSAQRISPGIRVFINPYANSRAVGVEIYAGPTAGFTPDQSYLLARGASTTFDFTNLTPGDVYYFKARSYDGQGNYSDVVGPVSAIAGYLPGSRVEGGTLDLSKFVSDTRPIKIVTSLPVVVSADDPDYKVGMLVNYYDAVTSPNGALYRLISTTGVPSTDWVRAIDTESIADEAVTANQILSNTITANEIDAGSISTAILIADAIKANMIEAGAITAEKIGAGEVTISKLANPDYDNLITNPGGETGDTPPWTFTVASGATVGISSSTFARSGLYALHIDRDNQIDSEARLRNNESLPSGQPARPGESFYMEAYARAGSTLITGGSGGLAVSARLAIAFRTNDGTLVSRTTASYLSLTLTHQRISVKGTVPSGAVFAEFELCVAGINSSSQVRYVYFDDVYARKVVNSALLRVDGEVEVTNSTQSDGAFSVKNASNVEVLRLGNIDGKSGVPAAINYGLWGALGTGVFIEGTFRIVRYGSFNIFKSTTSISNGSSQIVNGYADFEGAGLNVTVPSGRLYELLIFPRDIEIVTIGGDEPSVILSWYNVQGYRNVNSTPVVWDGAQSAGTYNDIGIGFKAAVHNASGSSKAVTVGIGGTFFLVDYDASLTNQDIVSITT